jgi:hypothetical protein
MYELFCSTAGIEDDGKESESVDVRPDEELYCTADGNTSKIKNARVVADFIKEKAKILISSKVTSDLVPALAKVLKISPSEEVPKYRIQRAEVTEKGIHSRFALHTEERIDCTMRILDKEKTFAHLPKVDCVSLYISHLDAKKEMDAGIRELEIVNPCFGLDVRGVGDSTPRTGNRHEDYFNPYGFDYFYASYTIMLDKTFLGGKVQDALAAINLLKANGSKEINLIGRGLGAIVAAFTAVLSDKINSVTLINAPVSYQQMIEDVVTSWPLSHMPPNMLKVCDLTDIYQALEAKSSKIIDQWDSRFKLIK